METSSKRVIIDVDVGSDDYVALLLLFNAEKQGIIKIEAITCTVGNTSVEYVARNVVRLLELLGRTDVPVYRGAKHPLLPSEYVNLKHYHGVDGLGDLEYDSEPDLSVIKPERAAVAMRDLIRDNPNEIFFICLGPLTNLALALKLDDGLAALIKELWVMGGNYTEKGGVSSGAEFNFLVDPEAAYIVLNTVSKPTYVLPWETCLKPKVPLTWRNEQFAVKPNPEIQFLNRVEASLLYADPHVWLICDAYVAAAFINPTMITKTSPHRASVVVYDWRKRGEMVVDSSRKPDNITVIEEIDGELFKELLLQL